MQSTLTPTPQKNAYGPYFIQKVPPAQLQISFQLFQIFDVSGSNSLEILIPIIVILLVK